MIGGRAVGVFRPSPRLKRMLKPLQFIFIRPTRRICCKNFFTPRTLPNIPFFSQCQFTIRAITTTIFKKNISHMSKPPKEILALLTVFQPVFWSILAFLTTLKNGKTEEEHNDDSDLLPSNTPNDGHHFFSIYHP